MEANEGQRQKFYPIHKQLKTPVIDGEWTDEVWQQTEITSDFTQTIPVENAPPSFPTEVKIFYDDNAIYIAAYCYDDEPELILKQLGNRDDNLNADYFRIAIDPYDKQQDFTSFQVTASGVQSDFRYSDGNFNAVWESAVSIKEDGWLVEMKIPYSALRFPKMDIQQWGMQMYRQIRRYREEDVWSPVDREGANFINYFGKLTEIKDINPPLRLSITPFLNLELKSAPNDFQSREFDWLVTGGADLKYGLNESFTLDMTLLPDFSQVQSDDNINNLSAFEVIFNEQRPFFQEGIDLFNRADLFYSRRIGSSVRQPFLANQLTGTQGDSTITVLSNPEKSKLLNAFKITGRTKKSFGVGIFNAIEGRSYAKLNVAYEGNETPFKVQTDPLSNYNIIVLDKNFKNNKSIYAINTNVTRSDGYRNGNVSALGFSANFLENNYNVRGSASYSVVNEKQDSVMQRKMGYQYIFDFDKLSGNFKWGWRTEAISKDYDKNDLGFIFQTNYFQHGVSMNYDIYEPFGLVRDLYTRMFISVRQDMPTGQLTKVDLSFGLNTTFAERFLSFYMGANASMFEEMDFYEARTEGQIFRRPRFFNGYSGISTDYRKKFAFDTEFYFSVSGANDGSYEAGVWMRPIYRVNDHLSMNYYFGYDQIGDNVGFADRMEGHSIFGKRDITNFENVFTGNYIFKNNLSIALRARHYWSRVRYNEFYQLDERGHLTATIYTDDEEQNNINYNAFNIDLLFNWQFAPGSALSVSYKNNIFSYGSLIEGGLFQNLGNLFDETQTNTVSIKLIYYLDYVTVRSWVHKRKNNEMVGSLV
jgi:hypothetical protein